MLEHFGAFPENLDVGLDVLVLHMGDGTLEAVLASARACREAGLRTEVYPDAAKLKRQFKYADDRRVPHVIMIGSDEAAEGHVTLRDMASGDQQTAPLEDLIPAMGSPA